MSRRLFQIQEVNYINHIGAWHRPELAEQLIEIANSYKLSRRETITESTVPLLRAYIEWAPKRRWPYGEWEYFYNYACARLARVEKTIAAELREQGKLPKIITTFGK